ncbi:hypothetical protein [Paucisalibacillus sp. EB02]|uniref:hypothetical protein n=1 Tax=Paucisalibacillus sp. EB02 TaxID=1347087 RepID=UPI0012DF7649|nr:hypothetical protein [Paucisalibacillus sp. EB02]
MEFVFFYITPIIAVIFFINCVSIAKKLHKEQDIHNQTFFTALMFGFIVLSVIWSGNII